MKALLKAVKGKADRFSFAPENREFQYRVVFEPRHADHFASNQGLNDHLPSAQVVSSLICSGRCVLLPDFRRKDPNVFVAFALYGGRLFRIPGTFDHARRIFMPKTGYLSNPNFFSVYDYRSTLIELGIDSN